MKLFTLTILLTTVLISCQQEKTAFVDVKELVTEYKEIKDLQDKYKQKDSLFQRKIDSLSTAFQMEVQIYQQNANKMSVNSRQEKEQELMIRQQILQQQTQGEGQQLQQESQTKIDSTVTKVKDFVKNYGKKNGYTYILGANEAGSVLYGKEEKDLTQEILQALNDNYKKP